MRYEKFLSSSSNTASDAAQSIETTARRLFASKGYHATTIREIAAEAGVTLSLVSYYFESKEKLATRIFSKLRSEKYDSHLQIDMSSLSSAEQLYVRTILIWQALDTDEEYASIFYSILEHSDVLDTPSDSFKTLARAVQFQYGIKVSERDNLIYQTALVGAEKQLLLNRYHGLLSISNFEIANLLFSNYLFNIGVSDKDIALTIQKGTAFFRELESGLHKL